MKKFIKIVDGREYEKALNYKYIPKRLLYTLQKHIKPKIVTKYIYESNGQTAGYGLGVLLKNNMLSKDEYKKLLIKAIDGIKAQEEYGDIEYLIYTEAELNYRDLKYISSQSNVEIPSGKNVFASNVISCVQAMCEIKKDEIREKEVFIVSDDTDITSTLVDELSAIVKFIAVFTKDDEFGQGLERDMLNRYGLCLHITNKDNKIYNNFDIILNLSEDPKLSFSNISSSKTIMDLSDSKILSQGKSIRSILIEDLFFKNNEIICCEYGECEFGELLNTSEYSLLKKTRGKIEKVKIKDKLYSIEEALNRMDFKSHSNSYFNKC